MTTSVRTIFSDNALEVLCKRYFSKSLSVQGVDCERCGQYHETEDQFINRVSLGNEEYRKELIEPLRFLPNSPTLFNVGTESGGTLSACFKFDVEDTMFDSPDGIMPVMIKAARVLKAGGGVGYSFHVRPEGAIVNSTHGKALGVRGIMRMYNVVASEITQGGKRDAAQMAILHCDHPDLEKFIHCKDEDPDHLGTFNISVALTDAFMEKATHDATSYERRILAEMAESAWRTGDPGCFFIDAAERGNPTPWLGVLSGTNPCGEVPLLRNEPCNLGSINLGKFFDPEIMYNKRELARVAALATRYLDDVLDLNVFPDPEIDAAARLTRKLGLGVCGFADLLTLCNIPYDSQEAVDLGEAIMKTINEAAREASAELGLEKGIAPCYNGDNLAPYRNATRTCIAPTGTIAIIMNASSGIEPYFSLENTRELGDGTILIEKPWTLNGRSEKRALYTEGDHWPKTANEISSEWHIAHQAAFQRHTDLAVSKTINMANSVTPVDILDAYLRMWKSGCKGGTVYRDGSRQNQVLKQITTQHISSNPTYPTGGPTIEWNVQSKNGWREPLPDERAGVNHKFQVGEVKGYIQVGLFDDGVPGEIFLEIARQGSTMDGIADWLAHEISIELQMAHLYGVPFTVFTQKWLGRIFEPSGRTTNKEIPFASSIADYLARWLNMRFAGVTPVQALSYHGDLCPDCGHILVFNEGCAHCSCGYEKC